MKLTTPTLRILIFLILSLFPVLAPVFTFSQNSGFSNWAFPIQSLSLFLFGLCLFLFNPELHPKKETNILFSKKLKSKIIFSLCSLLCLLLISFLLQKIGSLISKQNSISISKPEDMKSFFYCGLNFLFSSSYEELVYRFYLPDALLFLTRNFKEKKMVSIDCEIISIILFSLGHIYLGILSVINAAIACCILRICYKKTNSLIPGITAHFTYNIIQLLISNLW